MHVRVAEGTLAAGGAEIGDRCDPVHDILEVGLEAETEDWVSLRGVEDVPFRDEVARYDVFRFEVRHDAVAHFRGGIPFVIAFLAGGFDDEDAVVRRVDGEAGILWFTDAVEDAVAVIDVEAVDAFRFADEEAVDGDGFVAQVAAAGADGFRDGVAAGALDEMREGDGIDQVVAGDAGFCAGGSVAGRHGGGSAFLDFYAGDVVVEQHGSSAGADGIGEAPGHGFRA